MPVWTIMPEETLFSATDTVVSPTNQQAISYCGIPMVIENIADHQYKIIRLLSTNPDDYLDENLQPGSLLRF